MGSFAYWRIEHSRLSGQSLATRCDKLAANYMAFIQ